MIKVKQKFLLNDEEVNLMYDGNKIKCFFNKENNEAFVTDKDGNVVFVIHASFCIDSPQLHFQKLDIDE